MRPLWGVVAVSALVVAGSTLFSIFEGLDLFNSFYWTITVLTTVGFGDIVPSTVEGKLLYIGLVLSGIAIYGYVASSLVSMLSEERMRKVLAQYFPGSSGTRGLSNHVIMLGWSRFSPSAYRELEVNGFKALVVTPDKELAGNLAREGVRVLEGEIDSEHTLKEAGIERCKAVMVMEPDTEKSLVAILRARKLSPNTPIIVLSERSELYDVYREAGASWVFDAYEVAGRIMAGWVFESLASEVLADMAEAERDLDLVEASSETEETVGELERKGFTSKIILVERGERRFYTPSADFQLRRGDRVVMVGLKQHLENDLNLLKKGSEEGR